MRENKINQSILSKVSLIFLAALICLAFVGCGGQQAASETAAPDAATPDAVAPDDAAPAIDSVYSSYVYTSQEQLIEDTAFVEEELGYSPHDSHYGELSCELCHESAEDGSSELWCTSCHVGFKLPEEGWTEAPLSDFPPAESN